MRAPARHQPPRPGAHHSALVRARLNNPCPASAGLNARSAPAHAPSWPPPPPPRAYAAAETPPCDGRPCCLAPRPRPGRPSLPPNARAPGHRACTPVAATNHRERPPARPQTRRCCSAPAPSLALALPPHARPLATTDDGALASTNRHRGGPLPCLPAHPVLLPSARPLLKHPSSLAPRRRRAPRRPRGGAPGAGPACAAPPGARRGRPAPR